jgi:hypothetical protein
MRIVVGASHGTDQRKSCPPTDVQFVVVISNVN